MITVNPYLTFNGNCEEAFNFYKKVFGGEFSTFSRYKDMKSAEKIPAHDQEKIMHVFLYISKETALMGCDASTHFSDSKVGKHTSISVSTTSEAETIRVFNELSVGGTIIKALDKVFWGALFGSFIDKFGITWMISFEYKKIFYF